MVIERQFQGVCCHFNWHIIFHNHLHSFSAIITTKYYYLLLLKNVASRMALFLYEGIGRKIDVLPFLLQSIYIQSLCTYTSVKRLTFKYKHFTSSNCTCNCTLKSLASAWQIAPILKPIQLLAFDHFITSIEPTNSKDHFPIFKLY